MPGVKTPFGTIPKAGVYVVALAGGGALVYAYVKKKNAAKTPQATQAGLGTGTGQYGYGSSTYGYGAYGYGAYTYQPYGYGFGPNGLGEYPGGSYFGYGYYGAGVPVEVPQQASTNAQWSQAVVSALTAQGYTGQTVLGALGPYLTGRPVNSSQEQIIQAAIAVEGYPPIPGASGNPPGINTGGSGGGGGGQGGGGDEDTDKITIPQLAGMSAGEAHNVLVSIGLRPTAPAAQKPNMKVSGTNPKAGSQVKKGTKVTIQTKGYVK